MRRIASFSITFIVLSIIFTTGCKKVYQNKLIGKWKMEKMTLNSKGNPIYWKFSDDGVFEIANDYNSSCNDTVQGTYKLITKNVVSPYLEITQPIGLDGVWQIEKVNKKVLILCRVGFLPKDSTGAPYLRREFTKE